MDCVKVIETEGIWLVGGVRGGGWGECFKVSVEI